MLRAAIQDMAQSHARMQSVDSGTSNVLAAASNASKRAPSRYPASEHWTWGVPGPLASRPTITNGTLTNSAIGDIVNAPGNGICVQEKSRLRAHDHVQIAGSQRPARDQRQFISDCKVSWVPPRSGTAA